MECSIGISGTGRISTFEERVGGVAIFSEENYNNTIWQLGISKGSSLTKGAKAELILKEHGNNLAAAAKLLQSCPALCDLIDGSPLGSSVPGILQVRTLEWIAISFSNACKWSRSVVSDSPWPHGLQLTRRLSPWDFPDKRAGVGCHYLSQIIWRCS